MHLVKVELLASFFTSIPEKYPPQIKFIHYVPGYTKCSKSILTEYAYLKHAFTELV